MLPGPATTPIGGGSESVVATASLSLVSVTGKKSASRWEGTGVTIVSVRVEPGDDCRTELALVKTTESAPLERSKSAYWKKWKSSGLADVLVIEICSPMSDEPLPATPPSSE